ncbi:MAG: hypothetical protein LBL84_01260 [Candidatus Nomurabacteria bacterium]|jgi:hypothetical protein|nr:hypothetical protein [Candidatus Nomurabacteria bacterium]
MKQVPYEGNRGGSSCALSCYTMAARYLWPDKGITFEQLAEIADYHAGYVAWGFAVWKWMVEQGARIVNYDVVDYAAWARGGLKGFEKSISPESFEYYNKVTFDIGKDTKDLQALFGQPGFDFVQKQVTWDDVVREFHKPGICDVSINLRVIDDEDGFVGHRVVLLDITDDEVVFHDPRSKPGYAKRHEPLVKFKRAFDDIPDGAELCRYSLAA